ncbi:hypothetical protein KEM55_008849 [Ascosphaera atra]|nr:hypothetical protein KEM55_008849 [Ascosphaera atra]
MADMLITSHHTDLVTYCQRQKIPYTLFEDWSSILKTTKDIYEGKMTPRKVAAEEAEAEKKEGGNP